MKNICSKTLEGSIPNFKQAVNIILAAEAEENMFLEQMNVKHTAFDGERTPILKDGNSVDVMMEGEKVGGDYF